MISLKLDSAWKEAVLASIQHHVHMLDDLLAIYDSTGLGVVSGALIVHRLTGHYLSGLPYPWSTFRDRAFVFATHDAATAFIEKHQLPAAACHCQEQAPIAVSTSPLSERSTLFRAAKKETTA